MSVVAVDARIHQPALQIESRNLHRIRPLAVEADGEAVFPLPQSLFELVAEADVHGEVRSQPELVLGVRRVIANEEFARRADGNVGAHRITKKQAGDRVAGIGTADVGVWTLGEISREAEVAAPLSWAEEVERHLPIVASELHRVSPDGL